MRMKRRRKTSQNKPTTHATQGDARRGRTGRRRGAPEAQKGADQAHSGAARPARPERSLFYGEVRLQGGWTQVRLMSRELAALEVVVEDAGGLTLETGDIVRVRILPRGGRGPAPAAVMENLGRNPPGLASLVAIDNHHLPVAFPDEVVREAEELPAFRMEDAPGDRTGWRALPIVTIDGADARDFDDAVWAEPLKDGYRIIVAIADVAHYVRPGTDLDHEARERGNSTYLPDRVIPMLPERLSNDLCSLRPREDRPVLGVEMEIDATGRLVKHRFRRAAIHSAARLTYEQVQAAMDGNPDEATGPLLDAIGNLRGAYEVLVAAKHARGAMDLDLPEARVMVDETGQVSGVAARPRLASHRLIEELMILANVAAAEALSKSGTAGLYRIHDRPDKLKQTALKQALGPLGFTVPPPDARPKHWATLAAQINGHPAAQSLLRLVLQSQQQARYSPDNIGHYGLALPLYAHFTSPIRRYSDLVVHRALIAALKLGNGGSAYAQERLTDLGDHLAATERNSQYAEWEARDRMIAQYYDRLVATSAEKPAFDAVVMSVQPFGLFVAIEQVAEGLLPGRMLGDGWQYYPTQMCWARRHSKQSLRPGSKVRVRMIEADRVAGRLTFGLAGQERPAPAQDARPRRLY